jgi:hypothetical protein
MSLTIEFPGKLTGAVMGKGGKTLKAIMSSTSATVQLSQAMERWEDRAKSTRTMRIAAVSNVSIVQAYVQLMGVMRTELSRLTGRWYDDDCVRIVIPNGAAAMLMDNNGAAIKQFSESSGSTVEMQKRPNNPKEQLLLVWGSAEQTDSAVESIVEATCAREHGRHQDFLSQWEFDTDYNDHFETPKRAYTDILPMLKVVGGHSNPPPSYDIIKREDLVAFFEANSKEPARMTAKVDELLATKSVKELIETGMQAFGKSPKVTTVEKDADAAGDTNTPKKRKRAESSALEQLRIYDPYYCKGRVCQLLGELGCNADRVINENRDFYADIAAGTTPEHDILLTNPPYSGEHKTKLLEYLVAEQENTQAWRREEGLREEGGGGQMNTKRAIRVPFVWTFDAKRQRMAKKRGEMAKKCTTKQMGRAPCTPKPRPFLLLMPAWVAKSDYWHDFLAKLAFTRNPDWKAHSAEESIEDAGRSTGEGAEENRGAGLEKAAGVFYVCPPTDRPYQFEHPQATQRKVRIVCV